MTKLATVNDRCTRCTCRDDLLTTAVVEAARQFMAANLRAERIGQRQTYGNYVDAAHAALDALQDLRDSLAAERASRG